MSLQLQNVTIGSTSKKPVFESICISQDRNGKMMAVGQYRVDVVSDADGSNVASLGSVSFMIDHDALLQNPDFTDGYRIIRDLARGGLQSACPEYVSSNEPTP